jgi:hypothetical protein
MENRIMEAKLVCEECEVTEPIPFHCGRLMHVEEIDGKKMLVCWMGASCGVRELPVHHGKGMKIVEHQ